MTWVNFTAITIQLQSPTRGGAAVFILLNNLTHLFEGKATTVALTSSLFSPKQSAAIQAGCYTELVH